MFLPRRNPRRDQRVRDLERQAAAGDQGALAEVVTHYLRSGIPVPLDVIRPVLGSGRVWVIIRETRRSTHVYGFLTDTAAEAALLEFVAGDVAEARKSWGGDEDIELAEEALADGDAWHAAELVSESMGGYYRLEEVFLHSAWPPRSPNPLPDERLRELQRRASTGDPEAQAELDRGMTRHGALPLRGHIHVVDRGESPLMAARTMAAGMQGAFRAPHYTVSETGAAGEVVNARGGLLFIEEPARWRPEALEAIKQGSMALGSRGPYLFVDAGCMACMRDLWGIRDGVTVQHRCERILPRLPAWMTLHLPVVRRRHRRRGNPMRDDAFWRDLQRRMTAGDAEAMEYYKQTALDKWGHLDPSHPECDVSWGKLRDAFKLCFPAFETEASGFMYMVTNLVGGHHAFKLRYDHMSDELRAECLRYLLMSRRAMGYARRGFPPSDVSNLTARVRVSWTNKPDALQVRFFTRGHQSEPSFSICWSGWSPSGQ